MPFSAALCLLALLSQESEGKIFVKSDPAGARIVLVDADGRKTETGKVTPALLTLPTAKWAVELSLGGYQTASLSVTVDAKAISRPDPVVLERLTVAIDVVFEEGWQLFVDGKRARSADGKPSVTPCTIEVLPGMREIGLAREGFVDLRQTVDVTEAGVKKAGGQTGRTLDFHEKPRKGAGTLLRNAAAINLLALLDPSKDAVLGTWTIRNGMLVSDATVHARIAVPFLPPEEYDLRFTFSRQLGGDAIGVVLGKGDKLFTFVLGGWGNTISGFGVLGGKTVDNNSTTVKTGLTNGRRYAVTLQVRNDGTKAFVDGKPFTGFTSGYADVGPVPNTELPKGAALGLVTEASPAVFHTLELVEISGPGKKTR